jgi:hypothetical protein
MARNNSKNKLEEIVINNKVKEENKPDNKTVNNYIES